jgi:hypothetical protein
MTGFKRTTAAALIAVLLTIGACSGLPGGGGGGGNDPVSAANDALAAAESGGFGKLTEFACAAQKDSIANAFGSGDMSQLTSLGIDPNELFNSMKIDFQDMAVTPVSVSGSDATVHMKGKIAVSVDPAAARTLVKKILEAQNLTATDEMVDAALSQMSGSFSQTNDIDEDVKMVQENGKWVICS